MNLVGKVSTSHQHTLGAWGPRLRETIGEDERSRGAFLHRKFGWGPGAKQGASIQGFLKGRRRREGCVIPTLVGVAGIFSRGLPGGQLTRRIEFPFYKISMPSIIELVFLDGTASAFLQGRAHCRMQGLSTRKTPWEIPGLRFLSSPQRELG